MNNHVIIRLHITNICFGVILKDKMPQISDLCCRGFEYYHLPGCGLLSGCGIWSRATYI